MDPFTGMRLSPEEAREYGDYFENAKSKKSRVGYFYHPDIGCYQYGHAHPMKPLRIKITDTLIGVYQLKTKMFPLLSPLRCYDAGLLVKKYDIDPTVFHSDEYIDFLRQASTLHSLPDDVIEMHSCDSDVEAKPYCSGEESDASDLSFSSIRSGPSRYGLLQNRRAQEDEADLSDARDLINEDLGGAEEAKLMQRMPGQAQLQKQQQEPPQKRDTKRKRDQLLTTPNDLESEDVSWRSGRPGVIGESEDSMVRFNFGEDCPIFQGLYDFCRLYSTGSVLAARSLNKGESDIAINWSGGLHHAKKNEASGFCYINDCVLGILELLKRFERVLYLDIDIHHGDGVEEAFYTTPRVLTCSLHKFGDYFPGTGCLSDTGISAGQNYSLNLPLNQGIDDDSYRDVFLPLIDGIFSSYAPQAVVMQCGVDSVSGDRLGCFNLSVRGHGACVRHLKSKGVPLMVLGGGGYTLRNVPRCWVYETGLLLNQEIENDIPYNPYSCYFSPLEQIHLPTSNMENMNSKQFLHDSLRTLNSFLKNVRPVTVDSWRTNYPHEDDEKNEEYMDDEEEANGDTLMVGS